MNRAEKTYSDVELENLTTILTGSVDTGLGRTFVGDRVAQALARRLLNAGYAPPTRFFVTSEEALTRASQRGAKNALQEAINRLVEISERIQP